MSWAHQYAAKVLDKPAGAAGPRRCQRLDAEGEVAAEAALALDVDDLRDAVAADTGALPSARAQAQQGAGEAVQLDRAAAAGGCSRP